MRQVSDIEKLFIIISIFLFIWVFVRGYLEWDAAVYTLNGRYFSGENIYHENFRPPLLPAIYAVFFKIFGNSELIPKIISFLFSVITLALVYKFAKIFYDRKTALVSVLLFFSAGIFLYWSSAAVTEIPSLTFSLIFLIFLIHAAKTNRLKYFFYAGVMFALAFLAKYTAAYLIFSLCSLFIFSNKFRKIKGFTVLFLAFLLVLSPWLFFNYSIAKDPLYGFKVNLQFYTQAYGPNLNQIIFMLIGIGPLVWIFFPIFIFNRKNWKDERTIIISLIFVPILIFFILFSVKQDRFLIPALPLFTIFAAVPFTKLKHYKFLILFNLFIGILLTLTYTSYLCSDSALEKAGVFAKERGLSGNFYSTFWPVFSYYSGSNASAPPWPPQVLLEDVQNSKVDYILITSGNTDPCYARLEILNKLEFLTLEEKFSGCDFDVYLFRVDATRFDAQRRNDYLEALKC